MHACCLKNVDVKVSDEEIIVVLTAGLSQMYSTIVVSFDALDPDTLTLDFVITHLLNEKAHQHLSDQMEIKKEEPALSDITLTLKADKCNAIALSIHCFYCLGHGHFAGNCPVKERDIKKQQEEGRDKISQEAGTITTMDNWDSDEENIVM